MALKIFDGWDFSVVNAGAGFSAQFTDSGGASTITVATGTYCHVDVSALVSGYSDFATKLQTDLNADATLAGTYTVTFGTATNKYTIACTESFSMASINTTSQELLGFGVTSATSTSHVSTNQCYYGILGTVGAVSSKTDDYEPNTITEGGYAEDGSPFAISVTTAPIFSDFTVPFEPKAKTHKRSAAATVPYTFHHHFEHIRGSEPFLVVDDNDSTLHRLRADSTNFAPVRVVDGFDDYWDIEYKTHVIGRL